MNERRTGWTEETEKRDLTKCVKKGKRVMRRRKERRTTERKKQKNK